MNRDQVNLRRMEFRGPILDLGYNNPVIAKVIDAYAAGEIVTKEEALSKMVTMLAENWSEVSKRYFEMAMATSIPLTVPGSPR